MNMRIPFVSVLAVALATAACGGGDDSPSTTRGPDAAPSGLAGTAWEATEIYVDGEPVGIVAGSRVTFEVGADGTVGGTTGCNSYFGEAVITPDGIRIGQLGMTEMACGEPLNTQEATVIRILEKADRWAITSGILTLGAADGSGGMDFAPPGPVIDALLSGTEWILETIIEGDAARTPARATEATIRFDVPANAFSGSTGCNDFNGEVIVVPPEISVENIAWTERGCEQSIMEQENFVLDVIRAASEIGIAGDLLTIRDDGTRALVYRAVA